MLLGAGGVLAVAAGLLLWFEGSPGSPAANVGPTSGEAAGATEHVAVAAPAGELPAAAEPTLRNPAARNPAMDRLEDDERDRDPGRSGTEAAWYREFRDLAAVDPAALARMRDEVLLQAGPDNRRVAWLRAMHDIRHPEAWSGFRMALDVGPSLQESEAVHVFVIRFLSHHARAEAPARHVLAQVGFGDPSRLAPHLRRWAAGEFAAAASAQELMELPARLWRHGDPLLTQGTLASLVRNPDRAAAERVHQLMGYVPEVEPAAAEKER